MQRHRCRTMQFRYSSRKKSAHRKVEKKPKTRRRIHPPEQTIAHPKTNIPFIHFAPPRSRHPGQIPKVRKCAASSMPASSLACHQSFNTRTKVPMWLQTCRATLIDRVCCGSALAYPCCRHGRLSCAHSSCPQYCVGWAKIACRC
jgi:hypothetical protein